MTQLDGHVTPDATDGPVTGFPTSSSTMPSTVVGMLEALDVDDGMKALEIGTGTGYSTGLLCHRLGEDNVTSVEVDPAVSGRADTALEAAGYSTWTVTGDGLLGHPRNAPYDRTIATCAVRRIPYTWVRQTRPGGIVLATVGPSSWSYGTGLAKLTVQEDGTAEGRIIGRTSFMPARAEAPALLSGDLAARAAYADTERTTGVSPDLLKDWMPAFLAQLAAPGAQLVRALSDSRETVYLFDTGREAFAALTADKEGWTVRQGGPVALWDAVEEAVAAWREAGKPDITSVRMQVTREANAYWIGGQKITTATRSHGIEHRPALRWRHRHQPLSD
ncbi:methyltransferase domain-containing protein [Streptomyces blastmyceticus]|uniref:Protein-L-isoaspartate O-methyltransferase n=1 Tax=Streptomyces blastmyceticus TaxID=68180 RepID=A0ABN0WS73_9ACTN